MQREDISPGAYDISIIPNDFNVMTINSLITSGVIALPAFQRNYVWDKKRASRFIESLIVGLPVPQIFLYQAERNKYSIIDGQQRLLTIYFFIKQRFPSAGTRARLRRVFDEYGYIPENILADHDLFQDFRLQLDKLSNGAAHPLHNKKYHTLGWAQKSAFDLFPIRCIAVRPNRPEEDDGTIYEIFSRLNTGGLNLSAQEIRGCLYRSDFYKMLYALNSETCWRQLVGKKEEDDKFRDVEVLLRAFALLYAQEHYTGSMLRFLNRFSKEAQAFTQDKIEQSRQLFFDFVQVSAAIGKEPFLTRNGSFNAALFEAVFVAATEKILSAGIENAGITKAAFEQLKDDKKFIEAVTHSTYNVEAVNARISLARDYLYGNKS